MLAYKSTDNFIYIGQNNMKKEHIDKTILNISVPDLCILIKSSDTWFSSLSVGNDSDSDFIFSKINDRLLNIFNALDLKYNPKYVITDVSAVNSDEPVATKDIPTDETHKKDASTVSKSVEKKPDIIPNGTSKLVYSPSRGTVKIAKRTSKPKDKCPSEYSVYISDDTREDFFRDVRKSVGFSKFSKWEISDMYDPKLFTKWREIMRNSDGLKRG